MNRDDVPVPAEEAMGRTGVGLRTRTVRILLGEDDEPMRRLLTEAFEGEGYEVTPCPDGLCLADRVADLLPPAAREAFDLIVSDIRLPGASGLEILSGLQDTPRHPPVILITAFGDAATHEEARRLGAVAVLDKPFEIEQLLGVIAEVLDDAGR